MGWDVAGTSPCIPVQMEVQPGRETPHTIACQSRRSETLLSNTGEACCRCHPRWGVLPQAPSSRLRPWVSCKTPSLPGRVSTEKGERRKRGAPQTGRGLCSLWGRQVETSGFQKASAAQAWQAELGGWCLEAKHIFWSCPPGQLLRQQQVEAYGCPLTPLSLQMAHSSSCLLVVGSPPPFKKCPGSSSFSSAKGRRGAIQSHTTGSGPGIASLVHPGWARPGHSPDRVDPLHIPQGFGRDAGWAVGVGVVSGSLRVGTHAPCKQSWPP